MFKFFLHWMLFGMTMFAAADTGIAAGAGGGGSETGVESGADSSAADGIDSSSDDAGTGEGIDGAAADDTSGELSPDHDGGQQRETQHAEIDKETADLKGLVSRRILALKKEAPELAGVFTKYPKVQDQIESAFRRDMAYRELYPTVAEARQMREQFPNGMADVEQVFSELQEVEQLDQGFYGRDREGNYPGHAELIQNWFNDDRSAMVSMFRTVPKEWARLDPDSYNEVMGAVVGATLTRQQLPEWLDEIAEAAKDPENAAFVQRELAKIKNWSQGFSKPKAAPSEEERRVQGQREQFRRETEERKAQDLTRAKSTFFAESQKQQQAIIRKQPAVAEMLQTKALSDAKKNEIVTKIQARIRDFVKTTRGYKKLVAAYHSGQTQEALKLEKAMWSYPWVLNKFVRAVLAEETPALVRQNRERTRGAATQSQRTPVNRSQQRQQQNEHTGPYQEGGVWKKKDGTRFTTAEILRGLHLQA